MYCIWRHGNVSCCTRIQRWCTSQGNSRDVLKTWNQCSGSGSTFFGPPGSGTTSRRYGSWSGSGSGSFYHQAKIVRKTRILTVLWLLLDFLSLKNDVNVPSKSNKQKNFAKKIILLLASWRSMMKSAGSGSIRQRHGSKNPDPDPQQNVMDPDHCLTPPITKSCGKACGRFGSDLCHYSAGTAH